MKKICRALSLIVCVVFVMLSFSSCSQTLGEIKPATAPLDDKNSIRLPVFNTDSLNPYEAQTQYNLNLSKLLFEGLVKVNSDFTVTNVLAKKVTVSAEAVTAEINTARCFSDGSAITADDVEYSFNEAEKHPSFSKQLENFDEISTSGNSVTFTLKSPDKYAASCLDFPIVKKPADEDDKSVIGSGKYKIENSGSLIMNERWGNASLPKIRRIKLINMLDTQSGTESVEKGTISYYFQDMSDGAYQRKNVLVHETGMTNLVFLGMNSNNEHLKNAAVRQAISLLVPKETIAEKSYLGYATVTNTPFYPTWSELKNVKNSDKTQSKNEAIELLATAGYERDDELSKKMMKLRIIVNDDNAFKISAAENIETALESIGIDVAVEKLPFEYFVQRLQRGEYELYIGETKLTKNMSLTQFFSSNGGVSYGISSSSKIVSVYDDFLAGKVTVQRFVDYFDVASPFVPILFRSGIEMYTNEINVSEFGTVTDPFENIYTWSY